MYEKLTAFLPKLENSSYGTWICDEEHFPFVHYDDAVRDLGQEIYQFLKDHPEMKISDYREALSNANIEIDEMSDADVSALDCSTVFGLILSAYRRERFCDGALMDYLQQGCIEKWLKRLQEIDNAKEE